MNTELNIKNAAYFSMPTERLKSNYKYVHGVKHKNVTVWRARVARLKWSSYFNTELEAAKATDMFLISKNETPVNILKKK